MMYGTPGGMPVKFGGEVAYLCLAIRFRFSNEVWLRERIQREWGWPAAWEMSMSQRLRPDPFSARQQHRPVPFALPASRRRDVSRRKKGELDKGTRKEGCLSA